MDNSIKTLIESYNNASLVSEFVDLIGIILPLLFPIVGAIGVTYFAIRIFRRILHV